LDKAEKISVNIREQENRFQGNKQDNTAFLPTEMEEDVEIANQIIEENNKNSSKDNNKQNIDNTHQSKTTVKRPNP